MIAALALLLLAQGPATWTAVPDTATVGDTIYLSRTLPAPPGATARAQPLSRTATLEPLADPEIARTGGLITLRYAVALFAPGAQVIRMPSVELLYADGSSETILGDTAYVRVRSVLPAGDSLPPPQPALAPLARSIRRLGPAALLGAAVIALRGLWVAARRRVKSRPAPLTPSPAAEAPPVGGWVNAGELRAVVTELSLALRRDLASRVPAAAPGLATDDCLAVVRRERPRWPLQEIADVLQALDRARFGPAVPRDVLALGEQVRMLSERLAREA